ncbi:MAG: hypothetical protein ABF773_12170 [Lentilactobacillus hilgardii]
MFVFNHFNVDDHRISLLLPERDQAHALFQVVEADRDELRKWMSRAV